MKRGDNYTEDERERERDKWMMMKKGGSINMLYLTLSAAGILIAQN